MNKVIAIFKESLPWWIKICAGLALSYLPLPYSVWKEVGIFAHGKMDSCEYAYSVFKSHHDRVKPRKEFVSLELGPGDSLFSALVSWSFGSSKSYLVDAGDFADKTIHPYIRMRALLEEKNLPAPDIKSTTSVNELLEACSAHYLTDGLYSLRQIPDQSVDFIWSNAVLEDIRKHEFLDIMKELRRVLVPGGACSHVVDFKDHIDYNLNNLRFPDSVWESRLIRRSNIYTNRIRCTEMTDLFKDIGFHIKSFEIQRWEALPLGKDSLSKPFCDMSDAELCISGCTYILTKQ